MTPEEQIAEVVDMALLQQQEFIATTIAHHLHDLQLMQEHAHPDCLACAAKISVMDELISRLRNMFRKDEA